MDKERFFSASNFFKQKFGAKVYKLSLDAGCTCPNRDGTKGFGGCIFCSNLGSGEFSAKRTLSIKEQVKQQKMLLAPKLKQQKRPALPSTSTCNEQTACAQTKNYAMQEKSCATQTACTQKSTIKYIAYFQNFTNTYGDEDALCQKYTEALQQKDVIGISIATRPDCITQSMLKRIARLDAQFISIELGLQTANDATAQKIMRAYQTQEYVDAVQRIHLANKNIHVVTHLIFGLMDETKDDMMRSVDVAVKASTNGVKITVLHVLQGTRLADDYLAGKVAVLEKNAYFALVASCVERLPKHIVVHRLTGDGAKKILIAPDWTKDKKRVLNDLKRYFAEHNVEQGALYQP